ncbi:unnamed protein product [Phytomonas sp. Hart1]|nr:unnamed protein product [Phytomonas sp. Hart1]|eukprot:CCW67801.1 unnamed protein product [Phytomonas sp. isolate Hart1]
MLRRAGIGCRGILFSPLSPPAGGGNVSPYATDGGHIPVFSFLHGRIQRRNWVFRNPEWCDICNEPVGQWLNHQGRKDHALMDMHYTALVEFPRRWNPEGVLRSFSEALGVDLMAYHSQYGQNERHHRNELYAMMMTLEEAGMLYFAEPKNTYLYRMQGGLRGMDHQGALVLHEYILGPFFRLYPDAHIQDFSNLVDFITCSYNMETVYDLCGFYTLDKVALKANYKPTSPAALGLGGIATTSSPASGFESQAALGSTTPTPSGSGNASATRIRTKYQDDIDEEAFSRKATFVRQVLGQLRWLTTQNQTHPAGFTFPEHIISLGEICLRSLVVEIIIVRLAEYMVRAEPVWRSFGFERKRLQMQEHTRKPHDVLPEPVVYRYRPMSEKMDDLYFEKSGKLDKEVCDRLRQKRLPIPQEFSARV